MSVLFVPGLDGDLGSGSRIQPQSREPFNRCYKVGEVLGKGGFGTVLAGTRIRDGRQVAIKLVGRAQVTDWDMVSACATSEVKTDLFFIKKLNCNQ